MKDWHIFALLAALLALVNAVRDLKANPSAIHDWTSFVIAMIGVFCTFAAIFGAGKDRP